MSSCIPIYRTDTLMLGCAGGWKDYQESVDWCDDSLFWCSDTQNSSKFPLCNKALASCVPLWDMIPTVETFLNYFILGLFFNYGFKLF